MKTIKIEVLYPEFNNLYGDRGNLLYLTQKLAACDVKIQVIATHLHDVPAFTQQDDIHFLLIGPCTERQQELELEQLIPLKEAFQKRIESGAVTLATGNAFELFGEYIQRENGEKISAIGLFPYYAQRFEKLRYNELCVGTLGDLKITGFKNQLSHSYGTLASPMLTMEVGTGWNPDVKKEGVHIHNFFATYLIGPILPLNPTFTDRLVELLAGDAYHPLELPFEKKAYECRVHELEDLNHSISH